MANYRALAAAGRSIVDLLNRRFVEQFPAPPRPTAVLAGTADFNQVNSSPVAVIQYPAVSVYCYRVSVDAETRPGWSAVASVADIRGEWPDYPLSRKRSIIESELRAVIVYKAARRGAPFDPDRLELVWKTD